MRMMHVCMVLALGAALGMVDMAQAGTEIGAKAHSQIINNRGRVVGTAQYTQGNEGVLISIDVAGLPRGKHGMHFHEVGSCSDHDHFKEAGGHMRPSGKPHGYLNPQGPHEGNLPNLIVSRRGDAHVELYNSMVSINGRGGKPALLGADGSALIIHMNPDDHTTQPIGGSGARIACGVTQG